MSDHDEVRRQVSETYARAVSSKGSSPCGCGCGGVPKGGAAKVAGYRPEEVATLPADAAVHSFGCGNPVAFSGVREGDVVLDLGSGAGIDLILAAKKVGSKGRVIGIDMTDEMIEHARRNIAAAGLTNVEVRKGLIEDLPVETGSVDWVISNCVINLSPEKPRVFKEIARVLKPGGQMLVSDIVVEDLPAWLRDISALRSACVAGAISEKEYLAGLRAAGLADVEVRGRLVYEAREIEEIARNEIPGAAEALSCCGGSAALPGVAAALAGKVWSATFFARKPAPAA